MLASIPSIRPALLDALDTDAMIPTKVLLEQARRLIQEPIMSSTDSFPHPILIVIDSLDECDDMKMSTEIVRLLAETVRRCRWPLKVLFTSRAEPHILQTFQLPELCSLTYSLLLQDFGVGNDIRVYLRHSFEGIQESMNATSIDNSSPWPSDDEIEMIVQKAAGLFIFAAMVVKYVGVGYASPVARLQIVLQALQGNASAERSLVLSPLDMLYLDTLRMTPDAEKARLILGSVVFAFRPLSICGLNDLLCESQFNVPYTVRNLCSVLVISSSEIEMDGAVRIYHTSFRDFLTDSRRSEQYFVDPVVFHNILARACLKLMNRHLTVDMCNLGDSSLLNRDIEDLDKRCKLHIKEGLHYACRWFAHHVSQVSWASGADDALLLSLQEFTNRHLLNWIEVLSLTGELDSAVLSLREAADWLEVRTPTCCFDHTSTSHQRSPKPYEEVLSLFRDAERLVLMCYDSIDQAALQVYYSLPCTPLRVQIRTTYLDQLKNKFVITHGLDNHWNLCLRSVPTGAAIRSLAISASGRLIASAGDTPGIQLWDMLTGSNTGHFHREGISSCSVVFSPSGDYVAIGCDTGTIDVWDVATGQQLLDRGQDPHKTSVTVLTFSRDSLFIVSGAADGTVHVYDVSTGGLKHSFARHKGSISCLLFSFDDGLIGSCSEDTSIITSDAHSGRLVRRFEGHKSRVNSISFSPDNGRMASGSDDQTVRLWDARTGVCLRTFAGAHKKPIRQVWITGDNKNIVSVCNMDIYTWETSSRSRKSPRHIWSFNHYFRKLTTMFPAWYAKIARFVPADVVVRIAESDDGTVLYAVPSSDGNALGFVHGSSVFFLEFSTPRKRRWSKVLAAPSAVDEPPLFTDSSDDISTAVAMTLDTTVLVTSTDSGILRMWNTSPKNSWKASQSAFKRTIEGFWPTSDGCRLLVKPMVGLQLFIPAGTVIKDLETGGDALGKVGAVPSPDSRYFAYWAEYPWNLDNSFSIHIYNSSTGIRLKRIPGFFHITCSRFSAESDLFACAHGDGVVQVWEFPFVGCKTTIMTGHDAITALEFLPGHITLIVGSDQGHVEIRLVENGDLIYCVRSSPSKVLALAVPDDALIAVISHEDGSVFVWDPHSADVAPHCLLPKVVEPASEDVVKEPDGADFIKFMGGYRSVCTRSLKGIVCTFDLTRCLAEYAEREPEEAQVANAVVDVTTTRSSDLPDSDLCPDGSTGLTTPKTLGTRDAMVVLPASDIPSVDCTLAAPQNDPPTPESTAPQTAIQESTPPDTQTSSSPCPHLVSRSDGHIIYDRYLQSTYSVDSRQGWVYRGSRRMFWLPSDLRPVSPTALSASEDTLVILTWSQTLVCFDLRED